MEFSVRWKAESIMGWNDAPDYTPQWSWKDLRWILAIVAVLALPVACWLVFDVWLGLFPASRP